MNETLALSNYSDMSARYQGQEIMRSWTSGVLFAVFSLATAPVAQAQDQSAPNNAQCTVLLQRNQADGVFDVTRQTYDDGTCRCLVFSGSPAQAANVEARITRILETRQCPAARPMRVASRPGQEAAAGQAGTGSDSLLRKLWLPVGAHIATYTSLYLLFIDDENGRSAVAPDADISP